MGQPVCRWGQDVLEHPFGEREAGFFPVSNMSLYSLMNRLDEDLAAPLLLYSPERGEKANLPALVLCGALQREMAL